MGKYNYVYFDMGKVFCRGIDRDNYYYICTEDLRKLDNVQVSSGPLDYSSFLWRFLYKAYHHPVSNRYVQLPLKKLWYPYYFKSNFKTERPFCFIVSRYTVPNYLRYLKKRYPDCKIVLLHRDLIHLWYERNPAFTPEIVEEIFDLRMTYDEKEAELYGIPHFDEFESKPEVSIDPEYPLSDVFFAGYAKDRLPTLLRAYEKFAEKGLRCDYYIVGVPESERVERPGIVYADRQMSYREMLYRTVNSKCVLEICQSGAVGYTSRFLEAVMYNKKLITNNPAVGKTKFYDPRYIQCIDQVEDMDVGFVDRDVGEIDYHYKGEFSPVHLIERIEQLLSEK